MSSTGAQSGGGVGSPRAGERTIPDEAILLNQARDLGRDLCRSIEEKKDFPAQADYRATFKARMKRLVEYRKGEWPAEHQYWQEHLLG